MHKGGGGAAYVPLMREPEHYGDIPDYLASDRKASPHFYTKNKLLRKQQNLQPQLNSRFLLEHNFATSEQQAAKIEQRLRDIFKVEGRASSDAEIAQILINHFTGGSDLKGLQPAVSSDLLQRIEKALKADPQ